ncbi:acyl-CoA dehydrogenase family protein [Arthrobacter sp. StoSoilB20]|uniref:acyl-CoA dehydrogenase family protein n=1 Tax=Arthrobacter sp. StoSoilB20 TaxID=2830995 RepID=UPI001CC3B0B5|nr:acyl-CoA dehydrogenase family protein [Arthrobacter sp. StoSoilB20]BCW58603.1 acyl-CoA dehydrogenase [Arthrobacter sp. StoSoilB20]
MSITTHSDSPLDSPALPGSLDDLRQKLIGLLEQQVTEERLIAHDEGEIYDVELWRVLANAGFIQLEAAIGGPKAKHRSQTMVLEELGARATSMGVSFVVQYMGVELLHTFGTRAQQDRFLAPLFAGDAKMSFALSEPAGGTDVARAMTTRAVEQTDGSFLISGAKKWIGGASDADYLIVLARTSDIRRSSIDGITMFIVPRDTPGIMTTPIDTMGIRALEQCDIEFSDVRVPAALVLGQVDKGFRHVLGTLNGERLNGAAVALGIARGALDYAVDYVKERHAFGRPIGAFQSLQHKLVDSSVKVESARLLLERAALTSDEHAGADETLSAMAKLAAADAATTVTDVGMRAMGGWGFLRQLPMQRYFRDARLYTFAPLTDDMIRNYIGEQHLGLPRSY